MYASPNINKVTKFKSIRWARHAARMGKTKNAYKILVGKTEWERTLGRL